MNYSNDMYSLDANPTIWVADVQPGTIIAMNTHTKDMVRAQRDSYNGGTSWKIFYDNRTTPDDNFYGKVAEVKQMLYRYLNNKEKNYGL